ncbi:hypothetical protein EI94DRAFT_1703840 [Lactarius quietus]|nr:hypothetical protein EI94DRAFT_1703840 [Lactarius quietus]
MPLRQIIWNHVWAKQLHERVEAKARIAAHYARRGLEKRSVKTAFLRSTGWHGESGTARFGGHLTVDFLQAKVTWRQCTIISGWGGQWCRFALDEALSGFIIGHTQAEGFINILLLSRGVSLDGGVNVARFALNKALFGFIIGHTQAEGFNEHFVTLDSTVKASK